MRTSDEIRNKIDKYLKMLELDKTDDEKESYYHIIDALLWVIDDESGTPI